jgi:hypothetical protein
MKLPTPWLAGAALGAGLFVLAPGVDAGTSEVAPSARRCFEVSGAPGDVAVVNLTPILAQGIGHGLLVSSDVTSVPTASNVNYSPGSVDPNVALAPIGADGRVCFVNSEHDEFCCISSLTMPARSTPPPIKPATVSTAHNNAVIDTRQSWRCARPESSAVLRG